MRKIAALLLSSLALSASASDLGRDAVLNAEDCPAGTDASAFYKWQEGRFVRDGWVCRVRSSD